jgi:hypothetical protein
MPDSSLFDRIDQFARAVNGLMQRMRALLRYLDENPQAIYDGQTLYAATLYAITEELKELGIATQALNDGAKTILTSVPMIVEHVRAVAHSAPNGDVGALERLNAANDALGGVLDALGCSSA